MSEILLFHRLKANCLDVIILLLVNLFIISFSVVKPLKVFNCIFFFTCFNVFPPTHLTKANPGKDYAHFQPRLNVKRNLQLNHFTVNLLMAEMVSTNGGPQRDNCGVNNEHVKRLRTRKRTGIVVTSDVNRTQRAEYQKHNLFVFTNTTAIGHFQNYIF